ncbi:MAG TPA: VTT domain-containing protein [Myxococcales bacterium]|nr:VTT domain-containing protein [Myxococcales bacterium]
MALRKAAGLATALAILFALYFLVRQLPLLRFIVEGARALHALGWAGALATFAATWLLTLLLVPVIPLIVACGWLYGPWGALISLAAAVASAATAFALARALGASAAAQALLERPKALALADLAARGGALTVALVRLSPILPFTPANAVLGLTPMRLRDLVLGTALGMAPGTVLYAWAGSLLPSAEAIEQGEALHGTLVWVLFAVALAAATVLGLAAARRLRRA